MRRRPSSSNVFSRRLLAAGTALALSSGLLALVGTASGAVPGPNGKIAYQSDRNGNHDIFAVVPNGLGEALLIGGPANDTDPAYSPDGSKLAFVSDRSGNADVWVTDSNTLTNITESVGADVQPAWSPDGTQIAFVSTRDRNPEIYVTPASGGQATRLTFNTVPDGSPSWSPDGSRLVFESNRNGDSDIFVMNIDSGAVHPFTDNSSSDHSPTWSPDGAWIAFDSDVSGSKDIFVGAVAGGAPSRLTTSPADESSPAWAPSGSRLAFQAERTGASDIFSLGLDGTVLVRATTALSMDSAPDWRVLQPGDEPTAAERDRAEQTAAISDSVTTDALGNGATPDDEVVSSVTAAADGVISIEETDSVQQVPPQGKTFFGQQINISAPSGTSDKPLRFVFRLDATRVPDGADHLTIGMWRNSVEVPPCERLDGVATPDPCMLNVRKLEDGDILLIGVSSQASSWNFGLRAPRQIGEPGPSPTTSPSPSSPSVSPDVTRPTITGSATPPEISPNGDGRRDSLDVEAVLSESASWTFTVNADTNTTPAFTTEGEGESVALAWDGSGATRDGRYVWAITAHDAAGNEAIPLEGEVTVDRTRPVVTVRSPQRVEGSARITVGADEDVTVKVTIRKKGTTIKAFPKKFLPHNKVAQLRWKRPAVGRYKIVVSVADPAGNQLTTRRRIRVL